jgi:PmbA protein
VAEGLLDQACAALERARKAGADDAVAAVGEGVETEFRFRDGRLEKVQESGSRSLGLQIYVDGRFGSHATSDLRDTELRRFAEDAVALTRALERDPYRAIPDPALYAGRADVDLELVDPAIAELSRERALEWLRAMDAATHAHARVVSATSSVSWRRGAAARASTNGFRGETASTSVSYGSGVTLDEGNGKRPEAYRYVGGRWLADLPEPALVAGGALERALARLGSAKAPSARATLVVDPEAGAGILRFLFGALTAAAVQQRRSFLADRAGAVVASPLLTLTDDPLVPRGLGSRLFDGEGIAARRLPIVESGVLRSFYVDTYYGRKLGWAPTTGGPSNLAFAPGTRDLAGLLAETHDGFYVTSWLGGNADATSGDFSIGIRGHAIERGRVGAPVSEMNVTGNYLDLLANLTAVGNDPYPYSSVRTPTLVFQGVDFSGR